MIKDKHQRSQQGKTCLDIRDFFFLLWGCSTARTGCLDRLQNLQHQVHSGLAWTKHWASWSYWNCFEKRLDQMPSQIISNWNYSTILYKFAPNFSKLFIYDVWSRNEFGFGSRTTKSSVFCRHENYIGQHQNKNVCIWLFIFFLPKMVRFFSSFEEFVFTTFLWITVNTLCFL